RALGPKSGYNRRPARTNRSTELGCRCSMPKIIGERGVERRELLSYALTLCGITAAASVVGPSNVWGALSQRPLDPVNPDILFGTTSSLWGEHHDAEWSIKRIAALGLQGIEPYGNQIEKYRSNPLALKRLFDEAGI